MCAVASAFLSVHQLFGGQAHTEKQALGLNGEAREYQLAVYADDMVILADVERAFNETGEWYVYRMVGKSEFP